MAHIYGTDYSEIIYGTSDHDVIYGYDGDDDIFASSGNDLVYGGAGDDDITGGSGTNDLWGGSGADWFIQGTRSTSSSDDWIGDFTFGVDRIDVSAWGVSDISQLRALLATDSSGSAYLNAFYNGYDHFLTVDDVRASELIASDFIFSDSGAKNQAGTSYADVLFGSRYADTLSGSGGDDKLLGGIGNDSLFGGAQNDTLDGGADNDLLDGGTGADLMQGRAGSDNYVVDSAGDTVDEGSSGSSGVDRVYSSISFSLANSAHVLGSFENLTLTGSANINATGNSLANALIGNAGANTINGAGGSDVMQGLGGNDFYYVDNAADQVIEAASGGTDRVLSSASYTLGAAAQIEILTTTTSVGIAAINLTGNAFGQFVYGNAGANTLNGKAGADNMTGYGGSDIFVFDTALGSTNIDTITDYNVASDTIRIDDAVFAGAGFVAGQFIAASAFFIGAAAANTSQHIIYNSVTGDLIFDSNGSAAGGSQVFAHLSTGLTTMTNQDFFVI